MHRLSDIQKDFNFIKQHFKLPIELIQPSHPMAIYPIMQCLLDLTVKFPV